jgi:glucose/arabinose dehydrogenase/mono/diheme cytochrome c family protein
MLMLLSLFVGCGSDNSADANAISTDSLTIVKGEAVFEQHCSGCHSFRHDGIGPMLSGLTKEVSPGWIHHFIKDPQQLITAGDERATQLHKRYKVVMPSFAGLRDEEVEAIIAYMHIQKTPKQQPGKTDGELLDPIPDTIAFSNHVVAMKSIAQIPASSDSGRLPLTRITKLDYEPKSGNLFINDLRGKLYKVENGSPSVFLDIAKLKPKFINEPGLATGLGSFAFHPDFSRNGLFYTTHTESPGSAKADFAYADSIKVTVQWVLTEWKIGNSEGMPDASQSRELLRINMVTGIHGVQDITFNRAAKRGDKDYGLLYIGVGDGGCVEQGYGSLAHSKEKIWGTIIRIDPQGRNSANGKYGIPADNPFAKNQSKETVKEIYAWGFRNPHRITWTASGKMLACNIGQAHIESLNLIEPGRDYGWPLREGTFATLEMQDNLGKVGPLPANDSINKITYPVAQFDHDEGLAISGGFEYTGTAIPELKGKYLFGDIPSGKLYFVNVDDLQQGKQAVIKEWQIQLDGRIRTLKDISGTDRVDLHFGRDAEGEMYILTKPDGKVYKLVSRG